MSAEAPNGVFILKDAVDPPVVVDFEKSSVRVNPESMGDVVMEGYHTILKHRVHHRAPDKMGYVLAESDFTYKPQPNQHDPESVVLSWMLKYSDGWEATQFTRRVMRTMETVRSVVERVQEVGEHADVPNFMCYADAYRWPTDSGMELLAIVNHRDRLISVSNAAASQDPAFRVAPPSLSEIDLPTQLEEFGANVLMIGELAIPGIAELESAQAA
jgi:hypothetical protein